MPGLMETADIVGYIIGFDLNVVSLPASITLSMTKFDDDRSESLSNCEVFVVVVTAMTQTTATSYHSSNFPWRVRGLL